MGIDRRLSIQIKVLYALVVILIVLVGANFAIALSRPNERTQTIVGTIGPRGADGVSIQGEKGDKGNDGNSIVGPIGPKGDTGESVTGPAGKDGLTPSCYFEASQCRGADGESVKGDKGDNGRTPEMACVDGYVSWRYTDETTWKQLYPAACPVAANDVSE